MAKLTRAQMEDVIRKGGSVLTGGKIITSIDELPTEAELAKGDIEQEQVVAAQLQAQMAELKRQLDQLQGNGETLSAPPDGTAGKTDQSGAKPNDAKPPAPRK